MLTLRRPAPVEVRPNDPLAELLEHSPALRALDAHLDVVFAQEFEQLDYADPVVDAPSTDTLTDTLDADTPIAVDVIAPAADLDAELAQLLAEEAPSDSTDVTTTPEAVALQQSVIELSQVTPIDPAPTEADQKRALINDAELTRKGFVLKVTKSLGRIATVGILTTGALMGALGVIADGDRPTFAEPKTSVDTEQSSSAASDAQPPVTEASVTTTTEALPPVYAPGVGEQSARLVFPDSMCNEEVSVREASAEHVGLDANKDIIDILEIDPTPQQGCPEGSAHAAEQRAKGLKNRTREDAARFVINKGSPELPRLPDGSRPTRSADFLPIAQRSMNSNMFGEEGVVFVEGHRSTNSATFALLDNLQPGEDIVGLRGDGLTFTYRVNTTISLPAENYQAELLKIIENVTAETGSESLLVVSACDPFASKTHRVVSISVLQES